MAGKRRKILITGGTAGIGRALAELLAADHDVMITGSRKAADLPDGMQNRMLYTQADLTDPAVAAEAMARALLQAGWTGLDNVVLNAGTGFAVDQALETPAQVRATLDVNLVSSVLIARALFPWLEKTGGTLSFIGSVAHRGQGLFPAYAASKAGLHGLARALRAEWAGRVAVQIIHPGPTRTDMHEKAGHDPGRLRAIFLKPETVAAMIASAMATRRSPVTASFGRALTGMSLRRTRL